MVVIRVFAILALMEVVLSTSKLIADSQEELLAYTPCPDERVSRNVETETSPSSDKLVLGDRGSFSKKNTTSTQTTTDSNISQAQKVPTPSPWCYKYGRKKRSRYKLSEELNKKEPGRDILAQLDYDIEEQEMDKRSRIELLSYLDAALKNKNIELNLELRHLAKEEENQSEKEQVERVNSNAAVLTANIEQLNKRIKDLEERTLRMKKMKEQKLMEKIPEVKKTLNLLSRQNYLNTLDQQSSAEVPSVPQTVAPFYYTRTIELGKPELLAKDRNKGMISKQTSRANFGYVPYRLPLPYSDPLQILRLTNPDFAALGQPNPWLNSGWAGYAPNLYQPVDRQYPQSLYAALARHQALPVPLRNA